MNEMVIDLLVTLGRAPSALHSPQFQSEGDAASAF